MRHSLRPIQVKVNGLYNVSKAYVLVTLYNSTVWCNGQALTMDELAFRSTISYEYLKKRLPVFAGKRPYPLTGKLWDRPLVNRRAVEQNNRAVFVYRLSKYGREWVENKLDRQKFWEIVKILQKNWEIPLK